jgi:hypothetical protein
MQINYLKKLQENPKGSQNENPMRGLTLQEIQQLEVLWNNGNPFPVVLKEYLFLGGEYCWVFEMDSPHELRRSALYQMSIAEPPFTMPSRPYIIIGVNATSGSQQFMFIFLDETAPDPMLYDLFLFEEGQMEANDLQRIMPINSTLSGHINRSIDAYRKMQAKGFYSY